MRIYTLHIHTQRSQSDCYIMLQYLWLLGIAREKKWHRWIPEQQLVQIHTFFLSHFFIFKISPFLTWPWPDLHFKFWKRDSGDKRSTTIDFYGYKWHRKHVSHYSNVTFDYRDFLWPDHNLGLCLVWASYPCSTFTIPSGVFRPSLSLQW